MTEDPGQQRQIFIGRASAMLFLVLAIFALAVFRLAQLQILDHRSYTRAARGNWVRVRLLAPTRGSIYSRNGDLLAENIPGFDLTLVPDEVHDLKRTVRGLTVLLHIPNSDLRHFNRLRMISPPYQPIALLTDPTQQQIARFAVNRYRFPGVHIQAHLVRYYPYGLSTADSVGYVGRINSVELSKVNRDNYAGTDYFGKRGLELEYQRLLHGRAGYKIVKVNAVGRTLAVLQRHRSTPGSDLVLTLDLGLQHIVQQSMKGTEGAVVVMNPNNGAILALASSPTFNPNWFVNGISEHRYRSLVGSASKPLWNRALDATYSPGSTIKPYVALGALNDKIVTPQQQIFAGPYYVVPGDRSHHKFWDWTPYGHGWTDLKKAIAQSVDTYFYPVAYQLGIKDLDKTLGAFGFGSSPDLGIRGESAGILPSPAWKQRTDGQPWFPGDTVVMGIGQGYLQVTPLQLALAVSRIATHGHGYRPRLVRAIRNPITGQLTARQSQALPPVHARQPHYWTDVIAGMHAVTASPRGTAYRAFRGFPRPVAAKTGTAQVFGFHHNPFAHHRKLPYRLRDNALFEAFTPIHHPQLAVAVVVEHAGDTEDPAATVTRKIMQYWYTHRTQIGRPLRQLHFRRIRHDPTQTR